MKIKAGARRATVALIISCLMLPQALWAQNAVDESPNEFAMVGDLLVARPLGLVMVVGGAVVWVVSLPFTLLAGHSAEAAGTLIGGPVEATFMRCLGCRKTGFTGRDEALDQQHQEKVAQQRAAEQPLVESDFP